MNSEGKAPSAQKTEAVAIGGKSGPMIRPNPLFRREAEQASGENLSSCYQCEKCSTGCPVAFAMDILPHLVMYSVRLGLRDEVLRSSTIWVCASCETCTTRCPNDIDIAKVMDTLRQIAVKSGVALGQRNIHIFHSTFLDSIKKRGRVDELEMLRQYATRSGTLGQLAKQAKLGWQMFQRGKLRLFSAKTRGTKDIKKIFAQAEKGQGK